MRRLLSGSVIAALCGVAAPVFAERVIQNDSLGESVNSTVASAEIISGEAYEAVFDIPAEYLPENSGRPLNFLGVRVLMVAGTNAGRYCGRFSVELYDEGMNPSTVESTCNVLDLNTFQITNPSYKEPGAKFFDVASIPVVNGPLGFVVEGQPNMGNAAFQDLTIAAINQNMGVNIAPVPITTSRVRVVLRALDEQCGAIGQGNYYPIMVTDQDGVSGVVKNLLYGREPNFCPTFRDYHWEDFAPAFSVTPGDFAMRLIVDYDNNTTIPDAGMDMDEADAGPDMSEDTGVVDVGVDMSEPDTGNTNNATNNGTNNAINNTTNNGNNQNNANNSNNGVGILTVTNISPDSAPNDRNTDVVILGTGFEAGVEVSIGATVIGVTDTEPQRIRATVPSGLEEGTYDVIVTVPSGSSVILADGFTVTGLGSQSGAAEDGCGCGSVDGSGGAGLLFLLGMGLMRRRRERKG